MKVKTSEIKSKKKLNRKRDNRELPQNCTSIESN